MQNINGKHDPDIRPETEEMATDADGKPKKPWQPPAHVIRRGNVVTRIWANPNHWGEITWRVDQRFINMGTQSQWYGKSIPGNCLQDAVRGLYQAQVWISREKNPYGVWRMLPWNWF